LEVTFYFSWALPPNKIDLISQLSSDHTWICIR
jgi:hypothetical protein